ncbi:hypothetical protein QBC34DRAFT_466197 [Podospora aff. communis PSN243]|uniref:Apple domain-containing protein n=1 Tax=Podospora aff. communis PSN243 TaxID=3040156 RepID=A0AAV9GIR7_9PEZI|nr:hypothetical protein QBC34DRAFT_466197 [Podospora aff. communis PSN243]
MKFPAVILSTLTLVVQAQDASTVLTWSSTAFISDEYSSSVTVRYAGVQRVVSYINEAVASRNINRTSWSTVIATEPLESRWDVIYMTGTTPPPTVTVEGTTTEIVWSSPTVATVTFEPTTCINGIAAPSITSTVYTGEYKPFPGQVTTTKTSWPTAVTTYFFQTASYRVFTFTGTTATFTSTATGTTFLSTTVVGTRTIDINAVGRYYTRTRSRHTVTRTNRDHQLAYTTKPVEVSCEAGKPATVTRAAKCAPTNLISERDGRGIEVRVPIANWTFPIGFPKTLIGIPNLDASACCQLCLDNKGCAVSEWRDSWSGGCNLFYFNSPGLNDTCGTMPLEYYGDTWSLPEQASFIQVGCGSLTYLGVRNQFCPDCKVEQGNGERVLA